MQAYLADECRANALHCIDIAEDTHTTDRSEFLAFAEAWYQLADEIEHSERLISFIDGLVAGEPMEDGAERAEIASGVQSLRRLAAAFVAIPHCFIVDRLKTAAE